MPATTQKRHWLRKLLTLLYMLIGIALFYVLAILFRMDPAYQVRVDRSQPLLPSARAALISSQAELDTELERFPIPALTCLQGGSLRLLSGVCRDFPFEGGYGRLMQLTCQDAAGRQLQVISVYPARALDALDTEGFTVTGEGPSLAGCRTVRMDSRAAIRLHTQTETGFYAVLTQRMSEAELEANVRPLVLSENAAAEKQDENVQME